MRLTAYPRAHVWSSLAEQDASSGIIDPAVCIVTHVRQLLYSLPLSPAASALAFGFLHNARVLPLSDLARQQVAAAAFFRCQHGIGATTFGVPFHRLVEHFTIMVGPENMRTKRFWWKRARLWRFILLQGECAEVACPL